MYTAKNKMILFDKLYSTVKAGLPLTQVLLLAAEQAPSKKSRMALESLREAVKSGNTLSSEIIKHDFFSSLDNAVISAGEEHGRLDKSFEMLNRYYEIQVKIIQEFTQQMAYPVFLLHMAFIIPPLPSLFTASVTQYVINVLTPLSVFYGALFFFWLALKNIHSGTMARMILMFPIIGTFISKSEYCRFSRVLSLMLSSGAPIIKCLNEACNAVSNSHIRSILEKCALRVNSGANFSDAFSPAHEVPRLIREMIVTGETAGSLPESLEHAARVLENESSHTLTVALKIIPVILYLMISVYIGFQIISGFTAVL